MLIFIPAEGKLLGDYIAKRALDGPEVIHAMELAGKWLAQLHTHQFPLEKEFKVENEVDNIREWAELISKKYPERDQGSQSYCRLPGRKGEPNLTLAFMFPSTRIFITSIS